MSSLAYRQHVVTASLLCVMAFVLLMVIGVAGFYYDGPTTARLHVGAIAIVFLCGAWWFVRALRRDKVNEVVEALTK